MRFFTHGLLWTYLALAFLGNVPASVWRPIDGETCSMARTEADEPLSCCQKSEEEAIPPCCADDMGCSTTRETPTQQTYTASFVRSVSARIKEAKWVIGAAHTHTWPRVDVLAKRNMLAFASKANVQPTTNLYLREHKLRT